MVLTSCRTAIVSGYNIASSSQRPSSGHIIYNIEKLSAMYADSTVDAKASLNSSEVCPEEDGLEIENTDSGEVITDPFDPEQIKIRTVNIVISQLVSRIEHGEVELAPDFQRLSGIWNHKRKSRLIESLLLRIPIPVFYVAADEKEDWAVVDGIQRMKVINDYVTGEFAMSNLEYLVKLNGLKYHELPRAMQRRITETQLIINVIEPRTPPEVMLNVFVRINTGGMPLNRQEIRHALYPGHVRNFLKKLAQCEEFLKATDRSISRDRMADRECVLRFLAFHITSPEEYSDNDLDSFLGRIMEKINKMDDTKRHTLAKEFKEAMNAAYRIFGDEAFRKQSEAGGNRRPVNRALFESWGVNLASCTPEQINTLVRSKKKIRNRFISLMQSDSDFDRAISYATHTPKRVHKRFHSINEIVREFT